MKKFYFLLFTILMTTISFGQVIIADAFNYADGSLVGNGTWVANGGTPGDFLVTSGKAVVQHGTPSEDVFLPFTPVSGVLFYALDFTVNASAPISGGDYEYFAHFKDSGFGFSARLDVVPPTSTGDYSVGIASDDSVADAVWTTDLTYGVTYRAIVRYDQNANIAELWIDASLETDTSILGTDKPDPGDSVVSFALRQSDSSLNETVSVDNVVVGNTFGDVVNAVLAVSQQQAIDGFAIYPNPLSRGNQLNIQSLSTASKSVTIFDVIGKRVYQTNTTANQVNVSNLKAGMYFVKVLQDGKTATRKLVIE